MRVFVQGLAGEPAPILQALAAAPEASRGVTYSGALVPPVNRRDPAAFHPQARAEAFFLTPEMRPSFEAGRIDFLPMNYSAIYRHFESQAFDLALIQVAPPDEEGNCSLGIATDFAPAALGRAKRVLAEVNRRMPRTRGVAGVPLSRIDCAIETDRPLPEFEFGKANAETRAIAGHVAGLIEDGACLQIGIGQLPAAILSALGDRRRLSMHTGMIVDQVRDLALAGAMSGPILTGVALGTRALYDWCAGPAVTFATTAVTHDLRRIAANPGFVSINGALAVDLFGQVVSESLRGRQASGIGGFADFQRGARLAPGGRSIVALPATAGGKASRIVARHEPGAVVSGARVDVDLVATEHGVARLAGASLEARAERLIAIAAPQFRDELAAQWREIRSRL
ncbi:MAG: 4-hydroxybutyrate CoA-transferase [Alphaproteobacteria bacterium]|nr:4-hydroxybutyrate CoA-transferase [Alphaproteobacteria bacterium]